MLKPHLLSDQISIFERIWSIKPGWVIIILRKFLYSLYVVIGVKMGFDGKDYFVELSLFPLAFRWYNK